MFAVNGYYHDGRVDFDGDKPARKGRVLLVFTEDNCTEPMSDSDWELFNEFTGSIEREIDEKAELYAGLDEKYARID